MKITCFVLAVLGLAALASADSGFFVPKAFYNLDAEGHKSHVVEINPHQANILRRLRRQISSGGSTSSSSSSYSSSDGGPVYFTSHQVVQHIPEFESRFGGDSRPVGQAVHTTGVIENGKVVYQTTKTDRL